MLECPGSLMPKPHPLMRINLVTIHLAQPSDIGRMICGMAIRVDLEQLSSLFCCVSCDEREVVVGHVPHELSKKI